jgi:tRNA(Ile)-lysidine synthase
MLERLKAQVSPYLQARCWYIAYSGGLDSHVLLHALASLAKQNPHFPPLIAVHVNHQIQSSADDWELHCQQQAEFLNVKYLSFRVNLDTAANIEEQARKARYQVFAELLKEDDCIFFAHHQQDQIETFFYRLFRGAGLKGLQSIPAERTLGNGQLVRPFLCCERTALENYALSNALNYVNDPSNKDERYDRNFIRHQLLPVIRNRWPSFQNVIQRVIDHLQEAGDLLDELARDDLQSLEVKNGIAPSLGLAGMEKYSTKRQKNILRYWLSVHQVRLSSQQTHELFHSVIHANEDANPLLIIGNISLRRYQQQLFVTRDLPPFTEISWNGLSHCIVDGYGTLSLSSPLDIELLIRQRVGGETIKPVGSPHTRKLKTLLQEIHIPPWQREHIPLIYHNDKLIAVADLIESENAKPFLQGRKILKH